MVLGACNGKGAWEVPPVCITIGVSLLLLAVILSGCTTAAKYKTQGATVSPTAYNLETTNDALSAILRTVILYHGPGSWKQEALWDEYFLTISNVSPKQLSVLNARLYDLADSPREPGDDPWQLEKQSRKYWKHYEDRGVGLAMGMLATTATAGGLGTYVLAGSATAGTALAALPVIVAGEIVVVQVLDQKNRKAIEEEFQYRRLNLPFQLDENEAASGSLFFPQTPGPKKLVLIYAMDGTKASLEFDLTGTAIEESHLRKEGSTK